MYVETKAQVSCAVTSQLISAIVFATLIVPSNSECSRHLVRLCIVVCIGPSGESTETVFTMPLLIYQYRIHENDEVKEEYINTVYIAYQTMHRFGL